MATEAWLYTQCLPSLLQGWVHGTNLHTQDGSQDARAGAWYAAQALVGRDDARSWTEHTSMNEF